MSVADDLKDMASSNVGIGALGGAGLGLLLQALRPKDKDQNAWKEYLMSALLGAGLGAASGYAYDLIPNSTPDASMENPPTVGEDIPPGYPVADLTDPKNAEWAAYVEKNPKFATTFRHKDVVASAPYYIGGENAGKIKPYVVFKLTPEFYSRFTQNMGVSDKAAHKMKSAMDAGLYGMSDELGNIWPVFGGAEDYLVPRFWPGINPAEALYFGSK